jgi:hypothetical protein
MTAAALSSAPVHADDVETIESSRRQYVTRSLQGRVVWLAEAMLRLHGIKSVPEAADRILALESDDGHLHPIVEDIRGRAFRRDERLRKMKAELLVRQHRGSPMIQIVRVFELTEDGRFEIDYWCEICSIAMFELKECECCQGPIEFRRQKVEAPTLDD